MQVVVRGGRAINAKLPSYEQLDYSVQETQHFDANLNPEQQDSKQLSADAVAVASQAVERSGSTMLRQCAAALCSAVQGNVVGSAAQGEGSITEAVAKQSNSQPSWPVVWSAVGAGIVAGYLLHCAASARGSLR